MMSSSHASNAAPPGAATTCMSGLTPKFEKLERCSLRSVEVTHSAPLLNDGLPQIDAKSLPAAATTTTPFERAYSIASVASVIAPVISSACTPGSAPRLRLMTSAPWSADHRMPAAISSKEPPSSVRTLTASSLASGAVPATPVPLFVVAAAIPATCVPCGLGGPASGADCQSPLPQPFAFAPQPVKVAPPAILPARSGWLSSTPESTIAIVWPAPVDVVHAGSVWSCCWPHCRP
jgi:hypothetical protein